MTNIESIEVVGGVDTHKDTHHAAVVHAGTGKVIADREFPASTAGYDQVLAWMTSHGRLTKVGVEGTGSYGAGLAGHLFARGVEAIEVVRPNRQQRRMRGKSDPLDAINAARAVLSESATAQVKDRSGVVESIRLIRTTRRSAAKARKAAIGQIHAVLVTAPQDLRDALAGYSRAALVTRCARLRTPASSDPADPGPTARRMLRRLARRVQFLDHEIADADEELHTLLSQHTPTLLSLTGVGTETAGQLLTTVGENTARVTSEAALARLCGVAPIPASSGQTTRHRLHRGGDRDANSAIHMVVVNRLRWHEPTRAYLERRTGEGKTKKDIIRCLKRAVIRELYRAIRDDLAHPPAALDAA